MDFFDRQDRARRRTRWLVVWFVLAVAGIIASIYLAAVVAFDTVGWQTGQAERTSFWNPSLLATITLGTLALVGTASLYKILMLREGGESIARSLGGRPLDPNTQDLAERRLLNVVEEMALASGVPVPTVFLMDRESGINAFAAGFTGSDAVIGVTRGALEILDRDELQGVIAHEFSHILNGDMRLNLRLIGWLHGILVLALIGYHILRGAAWSSGGDRRSGGAGAGIALFGLALVIIGWIGVFFGRLIKSGVSRQREYLADASAVQFTRDPSGLAGALKKIGGLSAGSRMKAPVAEEVSHLFFANGVASWASILSTHPPLEERIRALDPSFDGRFPQVERRELSPEAPVPGGAPSRSRAGRLAGTAALAGVGGHASVSVAEPERFSDRVGTVSPERLRLIHEVHGALPGALESAAREPATAASLVYAILLDDDEAVRRKQLETLRGSLEGWELADVVRLRGELAALGDGAQRVRLPLVDVAVPALRWRSDAQYRAFVERVHELVVADRQLALFEYTLQRLISRHLAPHFGEREASEVKYYGLRALSREVAVLLSGLAYLSGAQRADAAFASGMAELADQKLEVGLLPPADCGLSAVDESLRTLALVSPARKRQLINASAATVVHDGRISVMEAELMRAVSDSLDCPMPPFLLPDAS